MCLCVVAALTFDGGGGGGRRSIRGGLKNWVCHRKAKEEQRKGWREEAVAPSTKGRKRRRRANFVEEGEKREREKTAEHGMGATDTEGKKEREGSQP